MRKNIIVMNIIVMLFVVFHFSSCGTVKEEVKKIFDHSVDDIYSIVMEIDNECDTILTKHFYVIEKIVDDKNKNIITYISYIEQLKYQYNLFNDNLNKLKDCEYVKIDKVKVRILILNNLVDVISKEIE